MTTSTTVQLSISLEVIFEIEGVRTRPEERKRLVEVILVNINQDIRRLCADLLVCAQNHHQEPSHINFNQHTLPRTEVKQARQISPSIRDRHSLAMPRRGLRLPTIPPHTRRDARSSRDRTRHRQVYSRREERIDERYPRQRTATISTSF